MFPRKSNVSSAEEKIPSKKNWRKRKFPQSKFPFRPEDGIRNSVKNGRKISVPSGKRNSAEKIPRNSVFKFYTEFHGKNSAEKIPRNSAEFRIYKSNGIPRKKFRGIPYLKIKRNSAEKIPRNSVLKNQTEFRPRFTKTFLRTSI